MNLCLHVVLCAASGCKHLRLYNIISVRFMLLCIFIFFTRVRACCRSAVQRTAYRRVIVVRPLPIYYFITSNDCFIDVCHLRQGSLCDRSCLSVCERDSTESRGRIWVNFSVFPLSFGKTSTTCGSDPFRIPGPGLISITESFVRDGLVFICDELTAKT